MTKKNRNIKKEETKSLHVRLPEDLWIFVRSVAYDNKISMNEVILTIIKKSKEKKENYIDYL
jgi:hypothetical protein